MTAAMLRKRTAAAVALGVLSLAGCSASRPPTGSGTPSMSMPTMSVTSPAIPVSGDQVNIDNFAFVPATLTVHAGSTVTWTNHDEEPHTVAASDGSFHSPGMGTGATFSHAFAAAGTFDYVCSIHPMMHGTVVVTP
jgi:plastocyanin